jgi:hypothetical protein
MNQAGVRQNGNREDQADSEDEVRRAQFHCISNESRTEINSFYSWDIGTI